MVERWAGWPFTERKSALELGAERRIERGGAVEARVAGATQHDQAKVHEGDVVGPRDAHRGRASRAARRRDTFERELELLEPGLESNVLCRAPERCSRGNRALA